MAGIPLTGALAFLATALVIAAVFACGYGIALWIARAGNEPRPGIATYGDVPCIPEGLRAPRSEAGGRPREAGAPDTRSHTGDVHTRHVGGV